MSPDNPPDFLKIDRGTRCPRRTLIGSEVATLAAQLRRLADVPIKIAQDQSQIIYDWRP